MKVTNRRPAEGNRREWAQLRKDNGEYVTLLIHETDGGWSVSVLGAFPSTMRLDLNHYSMRWLRELL